MHEYLWYLTLVAMLLPPFAAAQTTVPAPATMPYRTEQFAVVAVAKLAVAASHDADEERFRNAIAPLPPERWEVLRALIANDAASLQLFRSVVTKFGEPAKHRWPEDPEAANAKLMKLIEQGKITVDGEAATLELSDDEHPGRRAALQFTKADGVWKLDARVFLSGRYARPMFPDEIAELQQRPATYRKIAARVEQGEFKDADAVITAMAQEGLIATSRRPEN